jgi:hypothetical protein
MDNAGLVGSNDVFKDRETGSRWQQSSLEAISGPLQGQHVKLYPFLLTDWREWLRLHPNTLVLKPLPGYADRVAAKNEIIRQGLSGEGAAPDGVLRQDDRLKPKTMIVGLNVNGATKAYPLPVLQRALVINEKFGGESVVIVHQPSSDTTTAFVGRVMGKTLTLKAANSDATELTDEETHSHWNPYGTCISGPLRGSHLQALILEPEFWFSWSEFHPGTAIYSAPAAHN